MPSFRLYVSPLITAEVGTVGSGLGVSVGSGDGVSVGSGEGVAVGSGDGVSVGLGDGDSVGFTDGEGEGFGDGDSDTKRARDIAIFALRRYLLMGWEGIALIFNCNEPWARARCDAALDMIIEEPRYGSVIDEIRGALDC